MNPAVIAGKHVSHLTSEATGIKIPVIYARGMVFTAWQPTDMDIDNMKQGQPVWLVQKGTYIPEMSMIVGHQEMVIPRDMLLEAVEESSPDRQRMIEEITDAKKEVLNKTRFWNRVIASCVIALACLAVLAASLVVLHLWRHL